MDSERLDRLFDEALQVPQERRAEWLLAACNGDPDLQRHLQRLLDADARAHGVLEQGHDLIGEVMAGVAEMPQHFGVWRVLRPLGAGGMGEVWLAERDDAGFVQRAAIKQVAWPTPQLLQRFHRERQILARLEHPNIARLIDGGVDDSGCPYLSMEYVEGTPITAWVRAQALDVRGTMKLLLKVCDSVQYAHRNLVIHSDIKPSNLLVGADGTPKLLDFGIARVLAEDGASARTGTAARLLTPDYAAPEMLRGDAITTSVDVYALGVLMYELLTGAKPYRMAAHGRGSTPPDVRPPSAAVEPGLDHAKSRRQALRGDVDRIVLTAMAADPAQRYASVEALSSDMRRWLDGRAISVRQGHAWYRLRKFAARHRVSLAAAIVILLALTAATAFSMHAAQRARAQATRAQTVTRFLADMFRFADPRGTPGGVTMTAKQMLDAGAQRFDQELRKQPALAAEFSSTLGTIYTELGEYDRAIALFRAALASPALGPADQAQVHARLARALYENGDYTAAQGNVDQAMRLHRDEDGAQSATVAADLALSGEIARRQGDFKHAETLLGRALAMSKATLTAPDAQIAAQSNQLATLYGDMRRLPEARVLTEQALAMFRQLYGEKHLDVAENLVNLGVIDMQTDQVKLAIPLFEQAEAIYRQLLPGDHPLLANTLTNHARALDRSGRYADSKAVYLQALAMQRKLLGPSHPDIAATLNNMAVLQFELGEYGPAAAGFRQVLDIWKQQGKPDHPLAQISRIHLASTLRELGDTAQSESILRDARVAALKTFGAAHPITLLANVELGVTLRKAGKPEQALAVAREVDQAMSGKTLPPLFVAKADIQYALSALAASESDMAASRFRDAEKQLSTLKTVDPLTRSQALLAHARIAWAQDDRITGCRAARQAAALSGQSFGDDSIRTAQARKLAARCTGA